MRGVIVIFVLSFLLMKRGINEILIKRKYTSFPLSKIRSISAGRVKVRGKLSKIDKYSFVKSRVSLEKCLLSVYEIDVYRYGYLRRGYEEVMYAGDWRNFFIEDGTGKIILVPDNSAVKFLKPKYTYKQNIFKNLPSHITSFLDQKGIKTKYSTGLKKAIRVREYQLNEKDEVEIVGIAQIKDLPLKQIAEDKENNLYITGTDNFTLVFNEPDKKLFNELFSSLWFLLGAGLLILALLGFVYKFK